MSIANIIQQLGSRNLRIIILWRWHRYWHSWGAYNLDTYYSPLLVILGKPETRFYGSEMIFCWYSQKSNTTAKHIDIIYNTVHICHFSYYKQTLGGLPQLRPIYSIKTNNNIIISMVCFFNLYTDTIMPLDTF